MLLGFQLIDCYLEEHVAAVPVVVTVGEMKNTHLPLALSTPDAHDVGSAVPCFTVMVPLPRFGAVRRDSELLTLPSNLKVQMASPEVLQSV